MVAHLGGRRFDGLVTGQSVHFLDHAVAGIGPQFRGGFECGGLRVVELRPHGENATRSDLDVEVIIHRL